jgi:hypothetical protein
VLTGRADEAALKPRLGDGMRIIDRRWFQKTSDRSMGRQQRPDFLQQGRIAGAR